MVGLTQTITSGRDAVVLAVCRFPPSATLCSAAIARTHHRKMKRTVLNWSVVK